MSDDQGDANDDEKKTKANDQLRPPPPRGVPRAELNPLGTVHWVDPEVAKKAAEHNARVNARKAEREQSTMQRRFDHRNLRDDFNKPKKR